MPDLLTPRRFPVALTEEQARALEVAGCYFLGPERMGDGDDATMQVTVQAVEIVAGVRVEADRLRARRQWVRDAFSRLFRAILGDDPRMPSRKVRPLALFRAIREAFQ